MGDPEDSERIFGANRRYWDVSTPGKMERGSYPLEAFRAGESTLFAHERAEVGDVVTALAAAGLRIEFVHGFSFDFWHRWDGMVRDDAGRWRLPGDPVPLSVSVRATAE